MNKIKNIMVTFVSAFVLMLMSSLMVFAANEVEAGATVTVTFNFTDAAGVRGKIALSNSGMFASSVPEISVSTGSPVIYNSGNGKFAFSLAEPTSGTISLTYKVSDSAQPGDSCNVTISDLKKPLPDFSADTNHEPASMTETVVVASGSAQPTATPGARPTAQPTATPGATPTAQPTATPGAQPTATPGATPTATPTATPGQSDDDDDDHHSSRPAATPTAAPIVAPTAKPTLKPAVKPTVTTAPAKKVDYTKLKEAIEDANKLTGSDEVSQLWSKLFTAVNNGNLLLTSDDQTVVDEATTEILSLIDQIKDYLEATNATEVVIKEVEVEPKGEYCNYTMHKVWPILFFVSLIVNVLLGVYIFGGKKKIVRDNIPLVDYEISDDDE